MLPKSWDMAIEIRPFEDALWPRVSRFLHEHWQENHPLCQQDLFYWQYRGFGPLAGTEACRLLVDGERILGFLGAIPGLYRLHGRDVPGMALALWVVVEELRNTGLGILLMREVEKQAPVTVCLGVNPKVARYYTATGYKQLEALHRYVCPLETKGYLPLLNDAVEAGEIEAWAGRGGRGAIASIQPENIDPQDLANLWRAAQDRWQVTLERTAEFWAWRYQDAVGFRYWQFGDARQGAIIARLDSIREADRPELQDKRVLRIIEIVPASDRGDAAAADLLAGVLRWAREQGAVAADFQCSSTRLEAVLQAAGLRRKAPHDAATQLPELFNPLRRTAAPINLMVKVRGLAQVDFDAVYCVKSDGDMDRPVRWPDRT